MANQTTGLGVAAKIAVPGNETPVSTIPGKNNVTMSLGGTNGPTTFQLNPTIEDVAGNPWLAGPVFVLSQVASSSGNTAVYTGVITGGAANAYVGLPFTVAGFAQANNNGSFIAVASTALTLTLENAAATAETHAGTATSEEVVSPVSSQLAGAAEYALMGYAGITNTGTTVISGGNIGAGTGSTAITGGPALVAPAVVDNANVAAAQIDLAAAIVYYQGLPATLSGLSTLSSEGNGTTASTFTPGVYVGAGGLTMATGITLDALGNPNATFVFVAGSTINLGSGQTVALVNGAQAKNVVFVAGSAITVVGGTTMNGNLLAVTSVTLDGGVLNGRALANTGAVTIAAATTVTTPASGSDVFGNLLTYVVYGEKTVTGQTYIPSGTSTPVATVSRTGLLTAVARGQATAEVSFPAFNNSIPAIVSPGNIMNGLPLNKIYSEINVQVDV